MRTGKDTTALPRRDFLIGTASVGVLAAGAAAITSGRADAAEGNAAEADAASIIVPSGYYMREDLDVTLPPQGEVAFEEAPVDESSVVEELTCDLLVIGAGPAGLTAAASAACNGLSVVLLEKPSDILPHATCLGNYNSQTMLGADFEVAEQDVLDMARNASFMRCDEDVWKVYFRRSGEAADWLLDEVMDDSLKEVYPVTGDVTVGGFRWLDSWFMWPGGASGYISAYGRVRDYCVEKGVDIRYETPGVQLIVAEDGSVTGAYGKSAAGYVKVSAEKGTLLATGSYEYNSELFEKWVRPRDRMAWAWCNPCTGDTGDGHLMGLAVGAAMDDLPHPVMVDNTGARDGSYYSTALFGTMRVNDSGKRFCNNYLPNNVFANCIQNQHGAHCYNIMDANVMENSAQLVGMAPFDAEAVAQKFVDASVECATIAEVAEVVGCDEATIQATLDEWNAACDKGVDEQYQTAATYLLRIDTSPYYVMEESGAFLATTGGLCVNDRSEVLGRDGMPLGGLYASGNVSGSMFYDTYPHHISAVSTGRCLTFGYVLGRRLAGLED